MPSQLEERLGQFFPEAFQVKRLNNQIEEFKEFKEKNIFQHKMSMLRNQCFNLKVKILPGAYKNTEIPENLTKLNQQFKIVLSSHYPSQPPRVFFYSDGMIKYGLHPFRDYCLQILTESQWIAKFTLAQLLKKLPSFLERSLKKKVQGLPIKYPCLQEYFQVDHLYSWKFCQVFPVQLFKQLTKKQGFILINTELSELIILEDSGIEHIFKNCDYIQGHEIRNVCKKKNQPMRFILELKKNFKEINGRYGIQFLTQDIDSLLLAIIECAKISELSRRSKLINQAKNMSQSSQQEDQGEKTGEESPSPKKTKDFSQRPMQIGQIVQEILLYQSEIQSKKTMQNINRLTVLLQKAIQYYSAIGDKRYQIYASKMKDIFNDDISKALIESGNEEKQKLKKIIQDTAVKQQYKGILDLI